MKNRFVPGVAVAALIAIPALTNGCSSTNDVVNSVCCTDYKPGGDMSAVDWGVDASIKGEFSVFAQAASDFSAAASALANDVETSCKAIAVDLGADPNGAANANKTGSDAVGYWCDQAATLIGNALGNVTLTIDYQAPRCEISVSANADCQAKCSASAKCDYKVHPPVCTGGTLTVDCSGSCDVTAQEPTIQCEGSCQANCQGSCTATATTPMVACDGQCDGTCSAAGAAGNGIQADGTCKGNCAGKCTTRAGGASVSCKGTCSGSCSGSCQATPGKASVKCSGHCSGDYTPLTCTGGKLEGGCDVSADCQAHCNASINANANCTPPAVRITTTGTENIDAVVRTLETNLPNILLAFKTRGQAFVDAGQAFITSAGKIAGSGGLGVKGTTCAVIMSASVSTGAANAQAAFTGSTNVAGKLHIQ